MHGTYPPIIKSIFSKFMCSEKHKLIKMQDLNKNNYIHNNFKALDKADPINFPIEHSYNFGWSGKLCSKERELAGRELYGEIKELIIKYKNNNILPKVNIITCSHGGNVALNLANFKKDFEIEKLILLGCPVQHKTKDLIKHKIFKKTYLLYSNNDWIQIGDPQGLFNNNNKQVPFFSERLFEHAPNLKQVSVEFKDNYLPRHGQVWHIDFVKQKIHAFLPKILKELDGLPESNMICLYNAKIDKKNSTVKIYEYKI